MKKVILSQKIKQLRQEKGLTQAELAWQLGVQQQTVQKWENPNHPNIPPLPMLAQLAHLLGMAIEIKEGLVILDNEDILNLEPFTQFSKQYECEQWVNQFQEIPQSLLFKAYPKGPEDQLKELTKPYLSAEVRLKEEEISGTVKRLLREDVEVLTDEGSLVLTPRSNVELPQDDWLPICDVLWHIQPSREADWILEHLEEVSQLQFRIYQDEEEDLLFLGIDAAGFDFNLSYWMPLYESYLK